MFESVTRRALLLNETRFVILSMTPRPHNVSHPLLKRATAPCYPVYLLHPLFVFPGFLLVAELPVSAILAFPILLAIVLSGTLALSAILQRWWITRALLGLETRPAVRLSREVGDRKSILDPKVFSPDNLIGRKRHLA